MLPRLSRIVAGVAASATAAVIPATGPATRRTARYRTSTVSDPSTTCGRTMAQMWNPNRRKERAWIQKAPGNLSIETVPQGSKAPKKKSCQLCDMLRAAAP